MLAARITKIQDKPKPVPQKPDLYAQMYIPVGVILNGGSTVMDDAWGINVYKPTCTVITFVHALWEALASAETIIAVKSSKETYQNLYDDTITVWRWTSGAAYEIEEDDAHTIVTKWEEVVRLHQDLNSYFYNLLSEDPYGVLQPENGDPDDGQVKFTKIGEQSKRLGEALAQAAPSVKDRVREAYKNCLGADAHEWHSDEDEED
ncbi:hypothetical protein BDV30DRAFT_233151 [Aspergillus minisclerotigenes]|uniref:Uncharacterized protein n=1 Tax=Aspergillus minisclerotigenes TaxID=656917 RepID=A0A5N6JLT9_9EURO|nr:hypothetical protein BDV30DRAFT_233151 [Aspergillus minisclerotigenes]